MPYNDASDWMGCGLRDQLNCPIDHAPIFWVAKITGYQCTAERTVDREVVGIIKGKYEHRPVKSLVPPPLVLASTAQVDYASVLHARTFRFIAQIGGRPQKFDFKANS